MEHQLTMPKLGHNMEEGTVVRWLKQEGDTVLKGDIVLEVEAEKATVEIDALQGGVLTKILVPEGEVVPVGTPIAIIEA
jgi:pyruvate dehydrogenase E2 component (dihydrolipoamide acetyltransferase)